MNPLAFLMASQQGAAAAPPLAAPPIAPPQTLEGNPISVVGNVPAPEEAPPFVDPYANFDLDNRNAITERMAANQDGAAAADEAGRSGMFGTRGTLRDILGLLGDSYLMGNGQDPYYANQRQTERLGDAMTGYSVDPYAAAERAFGVSPQVGQQAMAMAEARSKAIAQAQNDMAREGRLGAESSRDALKEGSQIFGSYMGSLNPETWERGKKVLEVMKERFELGDEFQIPDVYDPDMATMYQMGGMPSSRQITARQGDERIRQADERNSMTRSQNDARNSQANRRLDQNDQRIEQSDTRNQISQQRADQAASGAGRRGSPSGQTYAPSERPRGKVYQDGNGNYEYVTSNGNVIPMTEAQARAQSEALRKAGR